MKLPDKHPIFTQSKDVDEICQPLFRYCENLNFYACGRFYDNGECFLLTNRIDYYQHHFQKEYVVTAPNPLGKVNKEFISLSTDLPSSYSKVIDDAKNLFKIEKTLALISREYRYYDMTVYGAFAHSPGIVDFYFNNLDYLKNFSLSFISSAQKLIKEAGQNLITLPKHMQTNFQGLATGKVFSNNKKREEPKLLQNHFNSSKLNIKFTNREKICLTYLAQGRTAKEIGKILGLSHRTIESRIEQIKNKIGCHHKSEVLDFIYANKILG